MPERITIDIFQRTLFGSRNSRRLRRSGMVPAVVYGRGAGDLSVTISEKVFMDKVGYSTSTGIINLKMGKQSPITAIVKDVQWDFITDRPIHVDFLRVSSDQIVSIPVHVVLENIPAGVKMGGILEHLLHEIQIKVRAKDIPHQISIDVSDMEMGDSLHLSDIRLPEGATLDMDDSLVVAAVVAPTVSKAATAEETEEEAEAESSETAQKEESEQGSRED